MPPAAGTGVLRDSHLLRSSRVAVLLRYPVLWNLSESFRIVCRGFDATSAGKLGDC